jgi:hypothetical protein
MVHYISLLILIAGGCKPIVSDERGTYVTGDQVGARFDPNAPRTADYKNVESPPAPKTEVPTERGIKTGSAPAPAPDLKGKTAYLLLHGLNSDASTWDALVENAFGDDCPVLTATELDGTVKQASCYRYNFITRIGPDGVKWEHGDGATFAQLGEEVGLVVAALRKKSGVGSLVIIAHSRGGLSARAFLQEKVVDSEFKVGLLTIGTPHRGTTIGMMKHYFVSKGIKPGEISLEALKFAISPSTGYMAQSFINGQPVRNVFSEEIWKLEEKAAEMLKSVSVLGQMYSVGLRLGQNIAPGVDLFSSSILNPARILPGDFDEMKSFIFAGVPGYWDDGDNMVSALSAQMSKIPGIEGTDIPILSNEMSKIVHADPIQFEPGFLDSSPNDGITGQTGRIQMILLGMTDRAGFAKFAITP